AALVRTAYVVIDKALNQEGLSATEVFGSWLSGAIAIVLVVAALVLAWDSIQAIQKYRAEAPVEAD
ncbi:MAG: hypothetical protein PVF45_13380, partial [Anaerolineae bacterium]